MRAGFSLLVAGVVLDLVFHVIATLTETEASRSNGLATAIHGLVLVGMLVSFVGLLQVAFRPKGAVRRKETQ